MPETSLDFGEKGGCSGASTPAIYRDAIVAGMSALKRAFPKSVTMQYANFMPGEWLPGDNKHYLNSVYDAARKLKVGVGGPDLFPTGRRRHTTPTAHSRQPRHHAQQIAVQEGGYTAP